MTTYFALYILIFLSTWVFRRVGRKETFNRRAAFCFFLLVSVVLALRHPSMGVDLGYNESFGYLTSFDKIHSFSWDKVLSLSQYLNYERGYVVFNKLVGSISEDPQFFLGVCAVISLAPIFYVIYKKSVDVTLSTFIYLGLPSFLILFSGLRQAIAIGLCFLSLLLIEKKKPLLFALLVLLASSFHASALLFLFAYPAYFIKLNKSWRIVSVLLLAVVFGFRASIFPLLCRLFGYGDAVMDNNGAILLFLVFTVVYVYGFLLDNDHNQGYLNLFYIACFCQAMAGLHSTVIRIGYYYMLTLVLFLPQVIKNTKDDTLRTLSKIAVPLCFILFSLYSLQSSSWAETYPYYWFWQTI